MSSHASTLHSKRYLLAGTGVRGYSFAEGLLGPFRNDAELVGLYDQNPSRMQAFAHLLGAELPCDNDFERITRERRPDTLIVCTPDATHDELIAMAFARGLDVVVEKPMATTLPKLRRILALEEQYQRKVRVAFNCRYMPFFLELKKLLKSQPIGRILHAQFEADVDLLHGQEYFRRWHAERRHSGGLLVHKATHHFDIMNWLLDDEPVEVSATGSLLFFGKNGPFRGSHCRGCEHREACDYVHRSDDWVGTEPLYFGAEHEDGYLRDRCIFREEVDVEDTLDVSLRYRRGAHLNYSLVTYSASAGSRLTLTGTHGKIETERYYRGHLRPGSASHVIRVGTGTGCSFQVREITVPPGEGPHEGGDYRMFADLFGQPDGDPWSQQADSSAGATSCLMGIMANESIRTGTRQLIPTPDQLTTDELEQDCAVS